MLYISQSQPAIYSLVVPYKHQLHLLCTYLFSLVFQVKAQDVDLDISGDPQNVFALFLKARLMLELEVPRTL